MADSFLFIIGMLFLLWAYFAFLTYRWKREFNRGNICQAVKIRKSTDALLKYNIFVSIALVLIVIAEQTNIIFVVSNLVLYFVGILIFAFPLLDWYTTSVAIGRLGASEANPVMNFVISKVGLDKIIFFTVPVVAIVSMELILKGFIPLSFLVFVLVYSAVIINNVMVIKKKIRLSEN